ncbi:MAG: glucose 1-dehydrogenase [Chloroflexi bacterium]|nr:glucose 1-dehydrogenase [Chloroflexota bacterium]
MGRFNGKTAIVTGGALGIGGGVARRLAADGANVLIADIADDAAAANVARIKYAGGNAVSIHANMGSHDDIRGMVDSAITEFGRLDMMVQNAWGSPTTRVAGSAVEVPEEGWDEGMAIMTKALFLGAKYAVPEMQKVGGGSIVNISSVHGLLMSKGGLVYEAAKSAVIGMTRQMAIDFGPLGIRVNAICPGHIVTEKSTEGRWSKMPETLGFFADQYPVRRVGSPEDIAGAISFLCSDDASFITGHPLVVDGGLTIQLQEDFGVQQAKYARANEFQMPY